MINLTINRIESLPISPSTSWLLGECMQARGMQEMWMRQRPEVLEVLREQAVIQSAESSNRIEGVTIAADRLRPVVLGKTRPLDRPEEELYGYRKALDWIFTRKRPVPLSAEVICKLHALAQGGMSGDAGQYKTRNNEIIEILPSGERKVRFVPTSAGDAPPAVEAMCEAYLGIRDKKQIPVLLLIAACVFDLLCIHLFRDGNGRVSRLLTAAVTPQVAPQVTPQVTELLRACQTSKSRIELQGELGLSDQKHFRAAYLKPALQAGLIEPTIPDKPRSRFQKYRLTAKGRLLLETVSKK